MVRKAATKLARPTKADLDRLRSAMKGKINTSDIFEGALLKPLQRDAEGVLPQRKSMIREAIEKRRKQLRLTPYRLWKLALPFHSSLSQSAVHEFLKGQRQLELPSAEALLAAVKLQVMEQKDQAVVVTGTTNRAGATSTAKPRPKKRVR